MRRRGHHSSVLPDSTMAHPLSRLAAVPFPRPSRRLARRSCRRRGAAGDRLRDPVPSTRGWPPTRTGAAPPDDARRLCGWTRREPRPDLPAVGGARPADVRVHPGRDRFHDGRPLTSADVRDTSLDPGPGEPVPHRAMYRQVGRSKRPTRGPSSSACRSRFAPFLATMTRGIVPAGSRAGVHAARGGGAVPHRRRVADGAAELSAFDGASGGPRSEGSREVLPDSNVPLPRAEDGKRQLLAERRGPRHAAAAEKTGASPSRSAGRKRVVPRLQPARPGALRPAGAPAIAWPSTATPSSGDLEGRADVVDHPPAGSWARSRTSPTILRRRRGASSTRQGSATRTATAPSHASG
jgi:hypothetical protein